MPSFSCEKNFRFLGPNHHSTFPLQAISTWGSAGDVKPQTKTIRITVKFEDLSLLDEGFCHFMAPSPMAKIVENWQDITFFYIFLHIRLQLSVKLHCCWACSVEAPDISSPILFLCLYQESHTEGGHKVMGKAEQGAFSKHLFWRPIWSRD